MSSQGGEGYEDGQEIGILSQASLPHLRTVFDFVVDESNAIRPVQIGNESAFINTRRHDRDLNCEAAPFAAGGAHHIGLRATRDIRTGEELFLSYGADYPMEWPEEASEFEEVGDSEEETSGVESDEDEEDEDVARGPDGAKRAKGLVPLSRLRRPKHKRPVGHNLLWT